MSFLLFGTLWLLGIVTAPVWVLATGLVDLALRGRTALLRASLFFAFYLSCEVLGVLASFVLWALTWLPGVSRARYLAWNHTLQLLWASGLLGAASRLFRLSYDVEGDRDAATGPILLLARHVSVADTLLPAVFVSKRHGMRLRYVLKRELLLDPCLDVVGNRLPNAFVTRGSENAAREIAKVRALAHDMPADEGLLIFPEGTRFTPEKRARVVERLEQSGAPRILRAARELRHVLPPQLGGVTAALEGAPNADIVFCAHTGFEGISTLRELIDGSLVGRTVHVRFWRAPRIDVPLDDDERVDWLLDRWGELDAWVATARDGDGVALES